MDIDKLFKDKFFLDNEINFYLKKKQIKMIDKNKELVYSHIKKAKHNLIFFNFIKEKKSFNDWLIVVLYYVLYHYALALIINKGYMSKNHYATMLILIKEYSINKDDIKLLNDLSIKKEDAEFYTSLKNDRENASYSTNLLFNNKKINYYHMKVLDFINRAELILFK